MKKVWADRWVKALLSGKFKQARGTLCRKRKDGRFGYCCLGVLEVIAGSKFEKVKGFPTPVIKISNGGVEEAGLTETTQLKTGVKSTSCTLGWAEEEPTSLIEANDEKRWDFKRIAVFIKKKWRTL